MFISRYRSNRRGFVTDDEILDDDYQFSDEESHTSEDADSDSGSNNHKLCDVEKDEELMVNTLPPSLIPLLQLTPVDAVSTFCSCS